MGEEVKRTTYDRAQRQEYRRKVRLCLDVFETMLAQSRFDSDRPLTGMEIECNLVDSDYQPAMSNRFVLDAIADPAYQSELGAYNIEFNVPPRPLPGHTGLDLEAEVRASLNDAEIKANSGGAHIVMIGILPTLTPEHLDDNWMSESTRYAALNDSIFSARGEDIPININGPEPLSWNAASIAPESACTSMQLHLQLAPSEFAANWNAAQVLAGPQLALAANSPYFFGHQLWSETRIELFAQSTDTRPEELKAQGVRPRVWFGERWITSVLDLFQENVRYFPSLLPEVSDEDPVAELAAGRAPQLAELRLHNGTVYRWNRPVYDVLDGRPHLRLENRVLPAGPTVIDMLGNSAFYYGMLRSLTEAEDPLWNRMGFVVAEANFLDGARHGIDARLHWPGVGEVTARKLVLDTLLPIADEGLRRWGVDAEVRDRFLGVIEGRARAGRNGASWQVSTVRTLEDGGMSRPAALAEMLRRYCEHMHTNEPVHTWDREPRKGRTVSPEIMDWDSAYREQGEFEGPPPWNIGEPQPELAALIAAGKFRSDVLDAGCGFAELSLDLAAQGYTVVGIDLTPTAVAAATKAAGERGLTTATFARADITDFSGYPPGSEGRFNTVVDSTLFHSLPVEGRDGYLRSIHRAAAPGAGYFVLVFAKGAFPAEWETKPNEVDEDELRAAVSRYWEIDDIRPAYIHANIPPVSDAPFEFPQHDRDDKGRMKLPAYLLTAHKAG